MRSTTRAIRPSLFGLPVLALSFLSPTAGGGSPAIAEEATSAGPAHLVVHGGAGTIRPEKMTPEREAGFRAELVAALRLGHEVLSAGGDSLDAVEQVIRALEDSPLFNAGRGAVFTAEGRNEMDASIMDGETRDAGAVASVTRVRHPISAARAVMEHSPHVMLSGSGADAFASGQTLEIVEPSFFHTDHRWEQLQERRQKEGDEPLPAPVADETGDGAADDKYGTVGAVALDAAGHLAAGTSTGGMTYKRHGRVGDSPIIGAGTYADSRCGVSSTGHGEYFIRWAVAHEICARMEHGGLSAQDAADQVIHDVLKPAGGSGGVIVLSSEGEAALVFNTAGMYRGWIGPDGEPHVAIYGDGE